MIESGIEERGRKEREREREERSGFRDSRSYRMFTCLRKEETGTSRLE